MGKLVREIIGYVVASGLFGLAVGVLLGLRLAAARSRSAAPQGRDAHRGGSAESRAAAPVRVERVLVRPDPTLFEENERLRDRLVVMAARVGDLERALASTNATAPPATSATETPTPAAAPAESQAETQPRPTPLQPTQPAQPSAVLPAVGLDDDTLNLRAGQFAGNSSGNGAATQPSEPPEPVAVGSRLPNWSRLPVPGAASAAAGVAAEPSRDNTNPILRPIPPRLDDLALLPGAGAVVAARLAAVGIRTYDEVAALTDIDLERVSRAVGIPTRRLRKYRWPEAARSLASRD